MKKRITCLILAFLLVFQLGLMVSASSGTNIASESRSGVVRILGQGPSGSIWTGSGFCVGPVGEESRYFVTNHHVVTETVLMDGGYVELPAVNVWIVKNSSALNPVTGLDTNQLVACEVVYMEDDGYPDIAVLKAVETIPGRVALPLLGSDDEVVVGQNVYALGYPGTSDETEEGIYGSKLLGEMEDVTITSGVVSRLTTSAYFGNSRLIQHDATINHGNSGGPLINENGAVIGINTYSFGMDPDSYDDNSSYAVRISYIVDVLDDLDIPYEIWEPANNWLLPVIIAAAVVAVAVVVIIIVVVSKKKKTKAAAASSGYTGTSAGAQAQAQAASGAQAASAGPADFRPRLQCLAGSFAGKRFSLNNSVRIGRDPNKNDLVFPQGTQGVSGVHCVLMVDNNTVWLKDLGSTYGTYVSGGRRLAANESIQLQIGDKFWLGSEKEMFVIAPKGGI